MPLSVPIRTDYEELRATPLPDDEVEGFDLVAGYWLYQFSIQIEPHSGFEFQTPSATFPERSGAPKENFSNVSLSNFSNDPHHRFTILRTGLLGLSNFRK